MPSEAEQPNQNLQLCVAIMSFSGFLRVVATMVLAYPDFAAKRRGARSTEGILFYIMLHVLILAVAAFVSIIGSFYGPISIAIPVQTGATLLFNVIAMGIVLKMRAFNKAQRTGTYVVFFSVLSLIDVGPSPQDGQNVIELLLQTDAMIWCLFVSASIVVAAVMTVPLFLTKKESGNIFHNNSFLTLTFGVTMANVGMATAGKTLGSLTGVSFTFALIYYLVASALGLLFSICSATECDQGIFTPLTSVTLILVNMITGIIIWQDWKTIDTWIGYMCACFLMCCGVYLLAEVDLVGQYLITKRAKIVLSHEPSDVGSAASSETDAWQDALETSVLVRQGTFRSGYSRLPSSN